MVATRSQTAQDPLALFRALLCGDAPAALDLLAGSSARWLALVAPLGNFTVLHAAVLGDAAAALPQLVAACAAAGISVDAQLDMRRDDFVGSRSSPMGQQLRSLGLLEAPHRLLSVEHQATALCMAVSYEDLAAVDTLLQAGAQPAGSPLLAAAVVFSLECWGPAGWDQLLPPLLQHGLDPLGPGWPPVQQTGSSLLVGCWLEDACELMLAHLEEQRAAGTLQLGSKQRCFELLLGACRCSNLPLQLVQHAINQLQQLLSSEAAGGEDAEGLNLVLLAAAVDGNPAVLSALLASQLPLDIAAPQPGGGSLLAAAAISPQPAACVRLLCKAGAVPTAPDLFCAIDCFKPGGVAALLAAGAPAIDTSQPAAVAPRPEEPIVLSPSYDGWSCPIHRTLDVLITQSRYSDEIEQLYKLAVQTLEALRAAGYRPTVYSNTSLPNFTWPDDSRVLPQLDPFDFYSLSTSRDRGLPVARRYTAMGNAYDNISPPDWVLFAARDGSWSPATHRHWPAAFKAAARTLLLAANRSSANVGAPSSQDPRTARRQRRQAAAAASGSQQPAAAPAGGHQAGCTLGALPAELLLRVVKTAAEPLSGWLQG